MKNCDLSIFDVLQYEKLKSLYVNRDWCRNADLFRDDEGNLVVFWQWLEAHGVGQDHYSCIVESIEDLKSALSKDIERGMLSPKKAEKVFAECEKYFK